MNTFPEFLDLSSWIDGEQSAYRGLPNKLWKICTSAENGLSNTIMMAFLLSSPKAELHQQTGRRIKFLFDKKHVSDEDQKQIKIIEKSILSYNPFWNSKRPIFKRNIQTYVYEVFEKTLASYLDDSENNLGESKLLKAASNMLKCSIVYYQTNETNVQNFELFRYVDEHSTWSAPRKLFIFHKICQNEPSNDDCASQNHFGFGMSKEYAFSYRREAFKRILKTANISDDIIKEIHEKIYEENFLISLLQSPFKHIVSRIFEFPYIVLKLNEAGFNMDPLVTDRKGFSAFYYSCLSFDTVQFMLLYNYASNNFYLSNSSIRQPQSITLKALKNINRVLRIDVLRSNKFSEQELNAYDYLKFYSQIISINNFQINIVEDVVKIIKKTSGNDINSTGHCNIQQMICILQKYQEYSYLKPSASNTFNPRYNFANYLFNNVYYCFLDHLFALMFFDKFLSLSFIKTAEGDEMDALLNALTIVASSLLLYIASDNIFPFSKHGGECKDCKFGRTKCTLKLNYHRYIPYWHRKTLLKSLDNLIKELEKPLIVKPTDSKDILNITRKTLALVPKVSNSFITNRFQSYLSTMVNLSTKNSSVKKMLIAERTLQVIGELLSCETITECPVGYLLCSYFPENLEAQLHNVRNHCLAKYRANVILGRLELEHDVESYEKIQDDMRSILGTFQPIRASQAFSLQVMLIEMVSSSKQAIVFTTSMRGNIISEQKFEFLRYEEDFQILSVNILEHIKKTLQNLKTAKEDKKIEMLQIRIKGQLRALSFLLKYIVNNINSSNLTVLEENSRNLESFLVVKIGSVLNFEDEIHNLLSLIKINLSNAFENCVQQCSLDCSSIHKIYPKMHKVSDLTLDKEEIIRSEVTKYVENIENLKKYCLNSMDSFSESELKHNLSLILMNNKDKKYIVDNYIKNPDKAKECLREVKIVKIIGKGEPIIEVLRKKEYKFIHWKLKYNKGLNKKIQKVMNQKIYFFINRIDKIKQILIEEDAQICYLWNRGKSNEVRKHVKLLVCQRYIKEKDTRAALETLLFDCMNILNNEEMRYLWEKSTNLFSGAYLRDILAHGNPLIEIVGGFLDPIDLPTALIDALIEIIDDRDSLKALTKLWSRHKLNALKELIDFVENRTDWEPQLRRKIKSSHRWKQYAALLPIE